MVVVLKIYGKEANNIVLAVMKWNIHPDKVEAYTKGGRTTFFPFGRDAKGLLMKVGGSDN